MQELQQKGRYSASPVKTKRCPRCESFLEVSLFGVDRSRPDKLHYYCKACTNRAQRKRDRKNHGAVRLKMRRGRLSMMQPRERVYQAVRYGAHSFNEILKVTNLNKERVDQYLAEFILDQGKIYSKASGEERLYFAVKSVARKPNVKAKATLEGFHSIKAIMPQRMKAA